MRSGTVRVSSAVSISFAVIALLSGCQSPVFSVRTSIQEGNLQFVSCDGSTGIDTVSLEVTTPDEFVAWHATGDGDFGADQVITYGELPPSFTTDIGPLEFDAVESDFQFGLSGFRSGVSYSDVWVVDGSKLVEGKWLDALGRLHDTSCGG